MVNKVVLATPFGPIIPSISPAVTCTDRHPGQHFESDIVTVSSARQAFGADRPADF